MQEISLWVCVVMAGLTHYSMLTRPQSQSDSGRLRLLKPAIIQTYPTHVNRSVFALGGHDVRMQTYNILRIVRKLVDFPPYVWKL